MQPTALHCTSTLGLSICLINGSSPPSLTMRSLFSAADRRVRRWVRQRHVSRRMPSMRRGKSINVSGYHAEHSQLTARLPSAALAALCTSTSWLWSRNMIGSNVSRPTSLTSFSVISANARAADLCKSTLSEKDSVERERRGSPVKKLVSERSVGNVAGGARSKGGGG